MLREKQAPGAFCCSRMIHYPRIRLFILIESGTADGGRIRCPRNMLSLFLIVSVVVGLPKGSPTGRRSMRC